MFAKRVDVRRICNAVIPSIVVLVDYGGLPPLAPV